MIHTTIEGPHKHDHLRRSGIDHHHALIVENDLQSHHNKHHHLDLHIPAEDEAKLQSDSDRTTILCGYNILGACNSCCKEAIEFLSESSYFNVS